jgi:hypothetical protein
MAPLAAARANCRSIVAISGLGGHAFGSFKERGGDHMWLRDTLPFDLTSHLTSDSAGRPMARVMTYGYESTVAESRSIQNLEDLATSFHTSLLPLAAGPKNKPIIFVAHSLGGLVVKQVGRPHNRLLPRRWLIHFADPHSTGEVEERGRQKTCAGSIRNRLLRCSPRRHGR